MIVDLLRTHPTLALGSGQHRPQRLEGSPSIEVRGPTASAARTRQAASRLDRPNTEVNTRRIALTQHSGQIQPPR